ncbi:MAG: hypothetical protein ACI9U2_001331 [Bradymonadia bacterium]|jgi:hypothetical protein
MRAWMIGVLAAATIVACDDSGSDGAGGAGGEGGAGAQGGAGGGVNMDMSLGDATPPGDMGVAGDAGGELDMLVDPSSDGFLFVDAAPPPPLGPPDEVWRVFAGFNDFTPLLLGFNVELEEEVRDQVVTWTLPRTGWQTSVVVLHGAEWQPEGPPYLLLRGVEPFRDRVVVDLESVTPANGIWSPYPRGSIWRATLPADLFGEAPDGVWSIQAVVDENVGKATEFELAELTPELDPFTAVDPWGIIVDRDLSELTVAYDGTFSISFTREPNGVPDLNEALGAIGLLGGDAAFNAAALDLFYGIFKAQLHEFFLLDIATGGQQPGSVPISIALNSDADAPPVEEWAMLGWSRIGLGGPPPPDDAGLFGRARLDWNNQTADDNTIPGLGIFTTTFVRVALTSTIITTLLVDYIAEAGGEPFGSVAGDEALLDIAVPLDQVPEAQRRRAQRFRFLLENFSLAVAAVMAHEIGHSLGLVKEGVPPAGMLAGVEGAWAVQVVAGGHLDTPGFNLMQPGAAFSFSDVLRSRPAFSSICLAYLRGQIILRP